MTFLYRKKKVVPWNSGLQSIMKAYLLKSRASGTNVRGFLIIIVRFLASQKNYALRTIKRKARREWRLINFFRSLLIVITFLNFTSSQRDGSPVLFCCRPPGFKLTDVNPSAMLSLVTLHISRIWKSVRVIPAAAVSLRHFRTSTLKPICCPWWLRHLFRTGYAYFLRTLLHAAVFRILFAMSWHCNYLRKSAKQKFGKNAFLRSVGERIRETLMKKPTTG